jgi:hypothetical protein
MAPEMLDGWLLLWLSMIVMFIVQVGLSIYLLAIGHYNMTMYTYWSFTLLTFFFFLMLIALWVEGRLLTALILFYFPIVLGSTFDVLVLITIAIALNGSIFSDAITTDTPVSAVHTGDVLLHVVPPFEILILLLFGLYNYESYLMPASIASWSPPRLRYLYWLYFLASPLVPMLIYTASFNIADKYPTGIPTWVLWLVVILIDVIWMTATFKAFTGNPHQGIHSSILSTPSPPNPQELAASVGMASPGPVSFNISRPMPLGDSFLVATTPTERDAKAIVL